jgi:hypothetical protein
MTRRDATPATDAPTGAHHESALAASHALVTLSGNRRTGADGALTYDFTCPSPSSYPFQWAWDSCFHAIALSNVDPPRAVAEIDSLLHGLTPTGFLPHMLLWQRDLRARATEDFRIALWDGWTSITVQPPVLGRAIERVYAASGDRVWLAVVLPKAAAFYEWLHCHRALPDGLLVICQPDESGLDASSKYDVGLGIASAPVAEVSARWHQAMRSLLDGYQSTARPERRASSPSAFRWIDVLFNTVYADALTALAQMLAVVQPADPSSGIFAARARDVTGALLERCWDGRRGAFWDIDLRTGEQQKVLTISSLFPLLLSDVPDEHAHRMIDQHLLNRAQFWLPFPVPSVAADEPTFDPHFSTGAIFRGSSWVNLNWYLYWGLRGCGRDESASELAERTMRMTALSGMRECYDPYTGAGQAAESFAWSSLILDLMAAEGIFVAT